MQAVRLLWIVKQVVIQRWLVCWLRGRQVLRTQRKLSYVGQFFFCIFHSLFLSEVPTFVFSSKNRWDRVVTNNRHPIDQKRVSLLFDNSLIYRAKRRRKPLRKINCLTERDHHNKHCWLPKNKKQMLSDFYGDFSWSNLQHIWRGHLTLQQRK